ncbi:MAG TPA: FAD-dependent thymidylate synthase [Epulopiscium sp.]|nr:FAD-dependent thymidylate synthase [Candidatus Epulonipiscium sp.]
MKTNCKVTLLTHTPEPEKYIAAAARLCYSPGDIEGLLKNLTKDKIDSFVEMLGSVGHESPFEHVSFTFGIEGVSRTLTHQLVRHRIGASYSQKSQRYVTEGQFEYVIPPSIENNPEAKVIFIKAMEEDQERYDDIVTILIKQHIEKLQEEGQDEKKAKRNATKMAIEDARFVLPNACETKIVVTMNARALFNFFTLRCCTRAQWEIRALANQMLECVKEVAPLVFRNCGPSCVKGKCKEGKMSCGRTMEMRDLYQGH